MRVFILKYSEQNKIQRQSITLTAPTYDPEKSATGQNNIWKYNRAPDGMKFCLMEARVTNAYVGNSGDGCVAIFDGHVYNTRWDIFPGVEDYELIGRCLMEDIYKIDEVINLHGWECKEYTIASRSLNQSYGYKANIIVWYYLIPMSRLEKVMYAVIHPKRKSRKGGPTTIDAEER